MQAVRKILAVLLILILIPLLWAQIAAQTARSLLTDPGFVKEAARGAGVYARVQQLLVERIATQVQADSAEVPITSAELAGLVDQVLPAARLQQYGEAAIDGLHEWIIGGTRQPVILLDFRAVRAEAPAALRALLQRKVAALPVCTQAQAIQWVQSGQNGFPPCKMADDRVNQAFIDEAVRMFTAEMPIPDQVDLGLTIEQSEGKQFWTEANVDLAKFRYAVGQIPWGWLVIAGILLLVALLTLDTWYTPFGWVGAPLLLAGGLLYLGTLLLTRAALPVFLSSVPEGGQGEAVVVDLIVALLGIIGVALRKIALLVSIGGLAAVATAMAGSILAFSRPSSDVPFQ